jgi:uncharacterized protein YndB with AHSA1/START domain
MPTFSAIVSIRASREQVWALLTDVEGYRRWNRTFPRISGTAREGAQLAAQASGAGTKAYRITVEEFLPETKMVWWGSSARGWTCRQTFALRSGVDGLVEFKIQEEHSGLLCSWWVGEQRERQAQIDRFAVALKQRAEALSPDVARFGAPAPQTRSAKPAEIQLIDNTSLQNLSFATALYSSTVDMRYLKRDEKAAPAADPVQTQHVDDLLEPAPAGCGRQPRLRTKCQTQRQPDSVSGARKGRPARSGRLSS